MYYPINVNSYSDSQFINPKPEELKDYVKVNLSKHILKQKLNILPELQK